MAKYQIISHRKPLSKITMRIMYYQTNDIKETLKVFNQKLYLFLFYRLIVKWIASMLNSFLVVVHRDKRRTQSTNLRCSSRRLLVISVKIVDLVRVLSQSQWYIFALHWLIVGRPQRWLLNIRQFRIVITLIGNWGEYALLEWWIVETHRVP